MTVYVDDLKTYPPSQIKPAARKYGQRWAHLTADSRYELHEFAKKIGLARAWFQDHPTLYHYDVTTAMRERAVRAGAIETTARERALQIMQRREAG